MAISVRLTRRLDLLVNNMTDLVRIEINIVLRISHYRIIAPGRLPQLVEDFHVLISCVVSLIMLDRTVDTNGLEGSLLPGRHDVPADPSIGQVI